MPAKFEIGEVAILVQDRTITTESFLCYNLEECEVIESLGEHAVTPNEAYPQATMYGYVVMLGDGKILVCRPHELRKRKRPSDINEWAKERTQQLLKRVTFDPAPLRDLEVLDRVTAD